MIIVCSIQFCASASASASTFIQRNFIQMEALNSIKDTIKDVANSADEAGRKAILDSLRDLQYSIEKPEDTMQRVIHMHLVLSTIRLGLDLKLFNILVDSNRPLSLQELALKTQADPALLGRILRMLSSLGIIKEMDEEEFAANKTTENLSISVIQAGIYHNYDVFGPVYQALPEFFKSNGYQNITETHNTVFQKAWSTDLSMWAWLHLHPRETARFNQFMIAQRSSTPNCFNFYPIEEQCGDWEADKPVFVDMGGASGQQCIEFRKRFPNIQGRVVLQDLPAVVNDARSQGLPEGVEAMVHDFYTPQVLKGAKFYYLRAILHDHCDDKSILILKNIISAMDENSLILLDEMALPNQGIDCFATQTDLTMLAACGSMERTEAQWYRLLEGVGLKVKKLYTYTHAFRLSVIVASL
ncbi:hypothetical protein HYFRA_00014103 [Hymenoscyphus fraxineus]|uniref:O-methyltransferase domain-containing protein n=1 Tax=Hymenoscyphus fraxineus TaxID=746836 RepID=A0A9N9LD31_9HELO|nr:hypothetical protein HYFRA_00014103 [Hymenoscyphus fraxineus]